MMTSNIQNSICNICEDTNVGQFTCNECRQSFCLEHITDHRQDIQNNMYTLTQNQDRLEQSWDDDSHYNQLFHDIDQWEEESINKIQMAADKVRAELKLSIEKSKDNLKLSFKQISEQIDKSKQLNNYSEIQINQWAQQLNDIDSELKTSFNIQIKEDEQTLPITLIKIKINTKRRLDENEQTIIKRSRIETSNNSRNEIVMNNIERFDKVFEKSKLYDENLVAINRIDPRSFISGTNLYSNGKHSIHFRLEKVYKAEWSCFFGIMTLNENMNENVSNMKSTYGVWSSGYNVNASKRSDSFRGRRWNEYDNVILTLDCDNKKIYIENKRIIWYEVLDINPDFCPFPWKFLTIIKGCKLRINNDRYV